ncbi:hypothetical protein MAR_038316 [Mya arenaria]|uniref:Uncharacterized protein n=1 Tax=Mya arenaria TaxID=6604 RepID=A0ABY7FSS7_MYAAR|nr:hypothetical protein MAR_038316 [Mya arenaria]
MAQQLATVGRFTNAMYRVGAVTGVISVASGLAYYLAYYKPRQKVFNKINKECLKPTNEEVKAGLARVKAGEEYADVIRDMVRTKRKEVQEKEMAAQQ